MRARWDKSQRDGRWPDSREPSHDQIAPGSSDPHAGAGETSRGLSSECDKATGRCAAEESILMRAAIRSCDAILFNASLHDPGRMITHANNAIQVAANTSGTAKANGWAIASPFVRPGAANAATVRPYSGTSLRIRS
jgi:hypothetical protein